MTTKTTAANGLSSDEAKHLPLIDKYLAEIKTIEKEIVRKRKAGQKTMSRIDRNLKEIQTILDRVAATH